MDWYSIKKALNFEYSYWKIYSIVIGVNDLTAQNVDKSFNTTGPCIYNDLYRSTKTRRMCLL